MHDGIHVENAGIPSATLCTDRFVPTAQGMAKMWGAEDYPTIFTPHPIENMTSERYRIVDDAHVYFVTYSVVEWLPVNSRSSVTSQRSRAVRRLPASFVESAEPAGAETKRVN